jgi:hypothetical protein
VKQTRDSIICCPRGIGNNIVKKADMGDSVTQHCRIVKLVAIFERYAYLAEARV